nr:bifunctional aminoglycoside phosphotransferase/ATP-binding protein [Halorhodospira halophila]
MEAHRALAEALQAPECYPWPVDTVECIETHISTVLLAGAYVVKLKKPLDLGFLDFSSLERRRYFCDEEVRLNGRLAPQIYLRRVAIAGPATEPRIDGEGDVLEYAVLMRRFPENELMSRLLREGRLPHGAVERLAETVARFHAGLPAAGEDSEYGSPEAVADPMRDNFRALETQSAAASMRGELRALERWTEAQLQRLEPLIRRRRAEGAVRECHGDLHLGNVAWHEDDLIIFDGIEFNPALRWIDTASEVAFTVMDLDFEGARRLRHCFLDRYLEQSGDYQALPLLPLYAVYRALVRAKINGHEVEQGGGSAAQEALCDHVQLAKSYTVAQVPELVITYGLSGSGKSVRARRLVEERGFIRLRSDVERKRLFGLEPRARSDSTLDSGLYSPEATWRTYERLQEQAEGALEAGFSVVVDAAFLKAERRRPFLELAARTGCRFRILHVRADEQTLRERLRKRLAEGRDPSEADETVLDAQLRTAQPPSGEEAAFVETVDADG